MPRFHELPKHILFISLGVLLLFSPFAVDHRMMYPTQFGQLFFFFSMAIIAAGCLLLQPSGIRHIRVVDSLLLLICIYVTAGALIGYRGIPPQSYWLLPALMILYAAFRNSVADLAPYFLGIILLTGTLEAIYGNLQLYNVLPSYSSIYKLTGTFFNPAPFAGYLIMSFPIGVGVLLYRHELPKWLRIIAVINVLTIFVVLPASASRAALFAALVPIISLILAVPYIKQRLPYIGNIVIGICIAGCLMFSYFMKKHSADGRVLIWKAGLQMISDKPLTGWGFDKFKANYMDYQGKYLGSATPAEKKLADNVQYAYNEFIHIAVEGGVIGLLLLATLLLFLFRTRSKNGETSIYLTLSRAGVMSLVVFSMFSYPAEIFPILIVSTCYVAIIAGQTTSLFSLTIRRWQLLFAPALVYTWMSLQGEKHGYISWSEANTCYYAGSYEESITLYEAAYPYMYNNGLFLSHYGKALSQAKMHRQSLQIIHASLAYNADAYSYLAMGDDYKALNKPALAAESYQRAAGMVPVQLYPRYCLAKLYFETNQQDKGIPIARELLLMSAKVNSKAVRQIKQEMIFFIEKANEK
jgi:O-antigen ligase